MNGVSFSDASTLCFTDMPCIVHPCKNLAFKCVACVHDTDEWVACFWFFTIHSRMYVLLIFAVRSTAASSASTLASVAEITSITNVRSGGSACSSRRFATTFPSHRQRVNQRTNKEGRTRGRAGKRLLADDERLDVRVPACWPEHVVDRDEVVHDVRAEEREEGAGAGGAHGERLEHGAVLLLAEERVACGRRRQCAAYAVIRRRE